MLPINLLSLNFLCRNGKHGVSGSLYLWISSSTVEGGNTISLSLSAFLISMNWTFQLYIDFWSCSLSEMFICFLQKMIKKCICSILRNSFYIRLKSVPLPSRRTFNVLSVILFSLSLQKEANWSSLWKSKLSNSTSGF